MYRKVSCIVILLWLTGAGSSRAFQALSRQEAKARATYIQALQAFENEQYQQSLTLINSVYPQLNQQGGVNFTLADIYYQLGAMQDAIHFSAKAVRLDPENLWYRLKLAELYDAAGQNRDAVLQLEMAQTRYPHNRTVLNRLAVAYVNNGSLEKANRQYNHLINLGGPVLPLRLQKIKLFSLLGQTDSLDAELRKIEALHPRDPEILNLLGNYYQEIGANRKALLMFNEAGRAVPYTASTLTMKAETYIAAARWDSLQALGLSAMSDSLLSPEQKMQFVRRLYDKWVDQKHANFPPEVMETITAALLEQEPGAMPARALAADIYLKTGDTDAALAQLAAITAAMPRNKDAWLQRLRILMDEDKTDAALSAALQADTYLPQEPFIYYAIGHSYLLKGKTDDALQWLKKGVALPARSTLKTDLLKTLGQTYFTMSKWQAAFDAYRQALNYSPSDASMLEQMGNAMHKLNKDAEARRWWEKALQQDPGNTRLQNKISQ